MSCEPQDSAGMAIKVKQQSALRLLLKQMRTAYPDLTTRGSGTEVIEETVRRGEEFANVFGIVGPRGAGKSTLLNQLYECPPWLEKVDDGLFQHIFVVRPLDCSFVLDEIDPGMAILLYLWMDVEKEFERQEGHCRQPGEGPTLCQRLRGELDEILSSYLWSLDSYRDLEMDLASSPRDYSQSLVTDVENRMLLDQRLAVWLCHILEHLNKKAILVLLDDFDLIDGRQVRHWLHRLLNEFHQRDLLFVLTGDFHRLEHLAFDHAAEVDDKTARAQLEKLLPLYQRVTVEPWPWSRRLAFRGLARLASRQKTLRKLLSAVEDPRVDTYQLVRLLPERPRGLVILQQQLVLAGSKETVAGTRDDVRKARGLLSALATCRGEPLLSRHLQENGVTEWRGLFQFDDCDLAPEDWAQNVSASRQRLKAREGCLKPWLLSPLRGLDLRDRRHLETSSDSATAPSWRLIKVETNTAANSQDPLRHEGLWHAPLRDATEEEQPFWTELLLDASFTEPGGDHQTGLSVLQRMDFLDSWKPCRLRLAGSQMSLNLISKEAYEVVQEFFTDYEDQELTLLLSWIRLRSEEQNRHSAEVGWPALLLSLRTGRRVADIESFVALNVDLAKLYPAEDTAEPTVGSRYPLDILPDRLWAMILLVDAVERCPWDTFSFRPGWHLATYLALTGTFLHGAYLNAMHSAGVLMEQELSDSQRSLLGVLERRNPSWLLVGAGEQLGHEEEAVFERLHGVLECPLPGGGDDSLSRAAAAFDQLPAYRALCRLADEGLYF